MAQHRLLCLRCRGAGHRVVDCESDIWSSEYIWMFEERRMNMSFLPTCDEACPAEDVCQRCRQLDLVKLLNSYPPWTTQDQLTQAFNRGHDLIRSLGSVGTVDLWEDCAVCRCLFALTPNPSSPDQEALLVPDWTICRVSGETGVDLDEVEKRQYATCLLAVLKPSSLESLPFPVRAHRADALCMLEQDLEPGRTLGGRRMRQDEMDYSVIREWLSSCMKHHGSACRPLFSSALANIHLVDVQTRQIVRHPGDECDYVALSYVWGEVKQPSYKVGDHIEVHLPQTLEDAVVFTRNLGKRYLWADSLCIDQGDHAEKDDQIQRMADIYQGAYVTLIAISGASADAGLPRVSVTKVPQQLSCRIDGKTLVGLMPTLSQQVWLSPWGQRAWTFQVSRLSPRCLLLSSHQLYFECKGFQCIETRDPKNSWMHNLTPASVPAKQDFASWMMGQGGSGCFRHSVATREYRLSSYGYGLNLYSARKVRYAEDCVKAFAGYLQTFREVYPEGFIHGLPVEDLNWALLWTSRGPTPRRPGFPSWSWAGWDGAVWFGEPVDVARPRRCPIDLEISNLQNGAPHRLFHTGVRSAVDEDAGLSIIIRNDPVDKASPVSQDASPLVLSSLVPETDLDNILLVDGITFTFHLDFSKPRHQQTGYGLHGIYEFSIKRTTCLLRVMSTDSEVSKRQDTAKKFILLARDQYDKFIVHYLLLIHPKAAGDSSVAERGTVAELYVPMGSLDILDALKPRRERVVLV